MVAAPALAQGTFEVDAKINCDTHTFTMTGAWSPFASNGANGGNSCATYVDVKIAGTGTSQRYNVPSPWRTTPAEAEASVAGVLFTIQLDADPTVYFYNPDAFLNNNGICGDNRGSVFITFDATPVAQAQERWGTLKTLYRR